MNSSSEEDFKTLTEYASGRRAAKDAAVARLLNQYFGDWFLQNHLGDGGQGLLFYATKPYEDQIGFDEGALKVTIAEHAREQDWKAYEAEVLSLRKLKSAYIARLLDADVTDNMPWLVSAFIQGQSVAQLLESGKPLPEAEWFRLAEHLFTALRKAHMHDIMHRDVKPQNIMFDEIDHVYILIDFGLAAREDCLRLGTRAGSQTLSKAEKKLGTLLYQAPEQIESNPSTYSDVFAAGVVLYQALVGVNPWMKNALISGEDVQDKSTFAAEILRCEPNYTGLTSDQILFFERVLDREAELRPTAAEALEAIVYWKNHGTLSGFFDYSMAPTPDMEASEPLNYMFTLQTAMETRSMEAPKDIQFEEDIDYFEDAQLAIHEYFDELPKKDFSVVVGIKDVGTFALHAHYIDEQWKIDLKLVSGEILERELEKAFINTGYAEANTSKWDLSVSGEKAPAELGSLLLRALRNLFPDTFPKIRLY